MAGGDNGGLRLLRHHGVRVTPQLFDLGRVGSELPEPTQGDSQGFKRQTEGALGCPSHLVSAIIVTTDL